MSVTAQNDLAARRVERCVEILSAYAKIVRMNLGQPYEQSIAELENLTARIKDNLMQKEAVMPVEAYFMNEAENAFSRGETPFQIQTLTAKATIPICQNFATYDRAAARIGELVKIPLCPMTNENLVCIRLIKRKEPETLINAEINAAGEYMQLGIGAQENAKPETIGPPGQVWKGAKLE